MSKKPTPSVSNLGRVAVGGPNGPFADVQSLLGALVFKPIAQHPDSPTAGDVIMYRDGSFAVVGDSPHVSYGPREEMVEVARLFPRPAPAEVQDDA